MPVVGSAYIVVNAITTGFTQQVQQSMRGMGNLGQNAGNSLGNAFSSGANKGMSSFERKSRATADAVNALIQKSYILQGAVGLLVPMLGSAAAGVTIFGLQALAAAPAVGALTGVIGGLLQGMIAVKMGFSGIGKAVSGLIKKSSGGATGVDKMPGLIAAQAAAQDRLTNARYNEKQAVDRLTDSYEIARQRIEALKFSSEDAVISEKRAAIEFEKARETLLRVQDLPPNSRARREAELAMASADLNLRKAKASATNLNTELKEVTANGTRSAEEEKANSKEVLDAIEARRRAGAEFDAAERGLTIANNNLDKGNSGGGGAAGGGDPTAGLSDIQADFAKFIAGLAPVFKEMKTSISDAMLPPVKEAIVLLMDKLFPLVREKMIATGRAAGNAIKDFAGALTTDATLKSIRSVMDTNIYVVEKSGDIFGNISRLLLALWEAAGPLIRRFTDWVALITGGWADKAQGNIGGITEMFNKAGDIAAAFGDVIGNLIGAFRNMGSAVTGKDGAGTSMLAWFVELSQGFEDFTAKHLASGKLQEYFNTAWASFKIILQIIGDIVKAILKTGGEKSLESSMQGIRDGVGAILDKMPDLVLGGAAFAEFIEKLLVATAALLESGSLQMFFGVITKALDIFTKFMSIPLVGKIFGVMAAMHGLRLGVSVAGKSLKTTGYYFAGTLLNAKEFGVSVVAAGTKLSGMALSIPGMLGPMVGLQTMFVSLGFGAASAAAAFALVVIAIAAVAAILYFAYQNSEILRDAVARLVEAVGTKLKESWDRIKDALKEAMPFVTDLSDTFKTIGDFIGKFLVPLLSYALTAAITFVVDRIVGLIKVIGGIITIFQAVWSFILGIFALFRGDIDGVKKHFGDAFNSMISGLKLVFSGVFGIVMSPFKLAFNAIASLWNNTIGTLAFTTPGWLGPLGNKSFSMPKIPIWGGSDNPSTIGTDTRRNMALGGTVFPIRDGTLVRVAEAGRAERIEPLDPSGLSKRDRALITMLTGGLSGKGITLNVYPSPGMDEVELASLVSRQLALQLRRGAA